MTREILVSLSPEDVLGLARRYFSAADSGYSGTIVEEGAGYIRFETFRGHLAVAASHDGVATRVRCSTLRYHPSIGKFLALLETAPPLGGG
jgi:hypothetical protein